MPADVSETATFAYVGSELTRFEKAVNWKRYWSSQAAPYVSGDVLEVGAGIGANTRVLADLSFITWTCLEPDAQLAERIPLLARHHTRVGTTSSLARGESFDTILYIDVLEHFEQDGDEVIRAASHLKPGGHLVVLSPAHESLYTPFDRAVGHFRRYSRSSLRELAPASLRERMLVYLDSVGMLASAANRLLLRQAMPTERQIHTWDRMMVPVSRWLDPLLGRRIGKSILGVWRRDS